MSIAAQCLHGARVCVIPHSSNDYRPYALRHRSLAIVSALLLAAKLVALGTIGLMPVPAELSTITSGRIVQLTNQQRAKAGLAELSVNDTLSRAATQKARDMLEHDYFAHISPAGVTPWFWMNNVGYAYRVAGENLAIDFVEAEDVVAAWMASPSHRENILRADYIETGVGVLSGEFEGATSIVVVHMFGLPTGAPSFQALPAAPSPARAAAPVPAAPRTAAAATPAAVPKVTVRDGGVIREAVHLTLAAQTGADVSLLVNNQVRATVTMPAGGTLDYTLPVQDLPDGELVIRAQAQNPQGDVSDLSAPELVGKDTTGPAVGEAPALIASPVTDVPMALMRLAAHNYATLQVAAGGTEFSFAPADTILIPLTAEAARITLVDAAGNASSLPDRNLLPSFVTEDSSYLESPARLSRVTRRATLAALVVISVLLVLAIVVRLNIQHPRMIAHALFVLGLAATLFVL